MRSIVLPKFYLALEGKSAVKHVLIAQHAEENEYMVSTQEPVSPKTYGRLIETFVVGSALYVNREPLGIHL